MKSYSFPDTPGRIWIFIPGIVEIEEDQISWRGGFVVFMHREDDLVPAMTRKSDGKSYFYSMMTAPGGGAIAQVPALVMYQ